MYTILKRKKEEKKGGEDKLKMIREYQQMVETELKLICCDILDVLDKHLIPAASTGKSKVFYYKMKGGLPQVSGWICHRKWQEGGFREQPSGL